MSGYLSSDKIRQFHRLRDRLILMLGGVNPGILRRDLQRLLFQDPSMKRMFHSAETLSEALGQVLSLFDGDFYQDPTTKRWSLTRRRQIYDAAKKAATDISARRRTGNTACGKAAEFLDAAEA